VQQTTETITADQDQLYSGLVFAGYQLDRFILNLLRVFYAQQPLQRFPHCRHLYYKPGIREGAQADDPDSMRIDMWSQWNPSRVGSAAAILVRRGRLGSSRIAIADKHQSPTTLGAGLDTQFTRVWAGSIAIWSLARSEPESSLLAVQTADYLQGFAPQIAKKTGIQKIEVRDVSDVKPLREQPAFLATAVIIEYGFFLTWNVQSGAPRLNQITLSQSTLG
jgi:hypothetical protein